MLSKRGTRSGFYYQRYTRLFVNETKLMYMSDVPRHDIMLNAGNP